MSNPNFMIADSTDSKVKAFFKKNEGVATEALTLIAKRNAETPLEETFEAMANTVGMMAAYLMKFGLDYPAGESAGAEYVRAVVQFHMENSFSVVAEKGPMQ